MKTFINILLVLGNKISNQNFRVVNALDNCFRFAETSVFHI